MSNTPTKTPSKRLVKATATTAKAPATKAAAKPAAPSERAKKAAEAKAKRNAALLAKIKADSRQIDKLVTQRDRLQARNDANVARARKAGIRFQDIAKASGRSMSWVQAAMRRANGTPIVETAEQKLARAQRQLEKAQAEHAGESASPAA